MTPEALLDLFLLSPVGLVEMDEAGRVEVANLAARRLLTPFTRTGSLDDLFDALELPNLWQTAHVIASVDRERRESRGPHYRLDYPGPREEYAGSYLVERRDAPAAGEPPFAAPAPCDPLSPPASAWLVSLRGQIG